MVKKSRESIDIWAGRTAENYQKSLSILKEVKVIRDELVNGNEESDILSLSEVQEKCDDIKNKVHDIKTYHEGIFQGEDSIKSSIEKVLGDLENRTKLIAKKQREILDFDKKIFGYDEEEETEELDEETGNPIVKTKHIDGMKDNFYNVLKSLSDQKDAQIKALKKLYDDYDVEIAKLLPKATSAGLAHAYEKSSNQYSLRAFSSHWLFILTALLLACIGLLYSFPQTANLFEGMFANDQQFEVFKNLLSPTSLLPVTIPLIWIAFVFQSKAKTYTRMHIEYQHKANLCKTFDGLKREANEKADIDLGKELLQSMVRSSAHNPAKNLDLIKSKTPLMKTYETAADKILETLKDIKEILGK